MLVIEKINKSFTSGSKTQTGPKILQDISFEVAEGEIVSIIGPTGCGKTTLLRIIDGILQPDSGTVLIDGQNVKEGGDLRCAMVFQHFNLFPWRNSIRNVEFGLESNAGLKADYREKRAESYIKLVGLKGYEKLHPHELSGGMQQRVGLARALAVEPSVVLFDEPFGSVDVLRKEQLQDEVLKILVSTKKTAIFVTHDIEEALFMSDRVISMASRPGRIKNVYEISLPRPRDLKVIHTPEAEILIEKMRADLMESLRASQKDVAQELIEAA